MDRRRMLVAAACAAAVVPVGLGLAAYTAGPGLPGRILALVAAAGGAALMVASVALLVLGRSSAAGPTAFAVRGGAFAVPANAGWASFVASQVLFAACLASLFLQLGRNLPPVVALTAVLPLLLIVAIVPAVVGVLRDRPVVELTPAGLTVRAMLGRYRIPWAALAPRPVLEPTDTLRLVFDPDSVRRTGVPGLRSGSAVSLNHLDVQARFLFDAIRYYVDHPEERATIGTPAAHDRLRAAVLGHSSPI